MAAAEGLVGGGVGGVSAQAVLGIDRVDGSRYAVCNVEIFFLNIVKHL